MPIFRQVFVGDAAGAETDIALDRRCLPRPQADRARDPRRRRRAGRVLPVAVRPARWSTRACSSRRQVGRVLPGPARRAGGVARSPWCTPVLDQHVPLVAAGPPLPLRRPQRRDQHGAGQPELDAGPRGAADLEPTSERRRRSSGPSRSARPAHRTPPAWTRCSSSCHLGGYSLPHAMLMMIPEAWENHESHGPTKGGTSTATTPPDGALGRPGLGGASPTARSSARCSTATACAPPATGSPRTASSSWPPRSACSTSTRPTSCRRAACSPAACS